MYFDIEAHRDCFKTNANEAYFWHGQTNDVGGQDNAMKIAGEEGKTLEACMLDNREELEKAGVRFKDNDDGTVNINYGSNQAESDRFWDDCSRAFAEQASGDIHVIAGTDPRPNGQAEADFPSTYNRIEHPALEQNPQVNSIIHVAPDTGQQTGCEKFDRASLSSPQNTDNNISSSNVESINGGGARAPNTSTELPDNPSNISGTLPPQNRQPSAANDGQVSGTLPPQSTNPPALKEHENHIAGQLPQREQQPQIESGNRAVANLPERNQTASNNQQISGELPPQDRQPSVTNEGKVSGTLPPQNTNPPASKEHENQISGTLPDQAQGIELPNNHTGNAVGKDLAENATKNNNGFDPFTGIS